MRIKEKLVRDARMKKGYSQDEIAHLLNISQSQYSKLENGDATFDIKTLSKLLDELELNPLEAIEFSEGQQVFIHSAMLGNHNNYSFSNYDIEEIRKIVKEEIRKDK